MEMWKVFTAAVVVCGLSASAGADDLSPAPYRGDPLTVEAHWDFIQPGVNFLGEPPDAFNSVGGSGGETLYAGFSTHIDFSGNWSWDGNTNIFPDESGGSLGVNLVNWVDDLPLKLLRIQVTYAGLQPTIFNLFGQELAGQPGEFNVPGNLIQHVDVDPNNFYEDWEIVPNPDWEQIGLDVGPGTFIDQIDVDTISIPEPAALVSVVIGLTLGCVILSRQRRS